MAFNTSSTCSRRQDKLTKQGYKDKAKQSKFTGKHGHYIQDISIHPPQKFYTIFDTKPPNEVPIAVKEVPLESITPEENNKTEWTEVASVMDKAFLCFFLFLDIAALFLLMLAALQA